MTSHDYLNSVLQSQRLEDWELNPLRQARSDIQNLLQTSFESGVKFYYGGSYGKDTMIRLNYDLDIVVYFPSTSLTTLKSMYETVFSVVQRQYPYTTIQKTVSIQVSYVGNFHIDVVPARLIGTSTDEANLYRTDTGTSLKTSVQKQVAYIQQSGLRDTMRLMKIWRERHGLSFKSFAMELIVGKALSGQNISGYDNKVLHVLRFIRDRVLDVTLIDPANSNNDIAASIPKSHKEALRQQAISSLSQKHSRTIIW